MVGQALLAVLEQPIKVLPEAQVKVTPVIKEPVVVVVQAQPE
jgi:hypothetical protein